jgi:hypothetical protein
VDAWRACVRKVRMVPLVLLNSSYESRCDLTPKTTDLVSRASA